MTRSEASVPTIATTRPRREVYAEQTRAALVEVATGLFLSKGYTDTSIAEIVDAARVSKGAFYHHFSDKKTLFYKILMNACEAGATEARKAMAENASKPGACPVVSGAEQALWALVENDPYRQLRAESIVALGLEVRREVDQSFTLPVIREALRLIPRENPTPAEELEAVALMLSSLLESAANEIALSGDPAAAYAVYRRPFISIIESAVSATIH